MSEASTDKKKGKKYPRATGKIYTEKKVDKYGREYQKYEEWDYEPQQKETDEKVETET